MNSEWFQQNKESKDDILHMCWTVGIAKVIYGEA